MLIIWQCLLISISVGFLCSLRVDTSFGLSGFFFKPFGFIFFLNWLMKLFQVCEYLWLILQMFWIRSFLITPNYRIVICIIASCVVLIWLKCVYYQMFPLHLSFLESIQMKSCTVQKQTLVKLLLYVWNSNSLVSFLSMDLVYYAHLCMSRICDIQKIWKSVLIFILPSGTFILCDICIKVSMTFEVVITWSFGAVQASSDLLFYLLLSASVCW